MGVMVRKGHKLTACSAPKGTVMQKMQFVVRASCRFVPCLCFGMRCSLQDRAALDCRALYRCHHEGRECPRPGCRPGSRCSPCRTPDMWQTEPAGEPRTLHLASKIPAAALPSDQAAILRDVQDISSDRICGDRGRAGCLHWPREPSRSSAGLSTASGVRCGPCPSAQLPASATVTSHWLCRQPRLRRLPSRPHRASTSCPP